MSIIAFLIYLGGIYGLSDKVSWWRMFLWPFYLGKRLGAEAERYMPIKPPTKMTNETK